MIQMELLTAGILSTLVGKTIYWKMPDGPEGIATILSFSENELITRTISGAEFDPGYVDKAMYKSYGRFLSI